MAYLNTVVACQTTWYCTVLLDSEEVSFKVDTGAEVTVISEDCWNSMGLSLMNPPTKKLHGPNDQLLNVIGELHVTPSYRGRQSAQSVSIVKYLQHNLLGLPAIQALQVLAQVQAVSTPIAEQYPTLFKGLSADRLNMFQAAQQQDDICSQLITFCKQGWPNRSQIKGDLSQYWPVRGELSLHDDLLLRVQRIVTSR